MNWRNKGKRLVNEQQRCPRCKKDKSLVIISLKKYSAILHCACGETFEYAPAILARCGMTFYDYAAMLLLMECNCNDVMLADIYGEKAQFLNDLTQEFYRLQFSAHCPINKIEHLAWAYQLLEKYYDDFNRLSNRERIMRRLRLSERGMKKLEKFMGGDDQETEEKKGE